MLISCSLSVNKTNNIITIMIKLMPIQMWLNLAFCILWHLKVERTAVIEKCPSLYFQLLLH